MDITPYLDLKIAPRAIFDSLSIRKDRARFMVPTGTPGEWRPVAARPTAGLPAAATSYTPSGCGAAAGGGAAPGPTRIHFHRRPRDCPAGARGHQ